MELTKHLYFILFPNNALVASQLSPELFAKHYTVGASRHYEGKVIFAEIDINFRHPFFTIDKILKETIQHEDGRPKATKFISTYRVLEHIDYSAIQKLYLVSPDGYCISLEESPYSDMHKPGFIRIFAEIAPMRMLVLSDHNFIDFGKYITNPANTKSAPKQFYTQIELDMVEFLDEFEKNPFHPTPIKGLHSSTLRDGFLEMRKYPDKHSKGLCMNSSLNRLSYKLIRHGFMFSSQEESRYFPMPSSEEIEKTNFKFWRSM